MDLDPRNPLLSLTYFCQGKYHQSVEELRQMILYTNVELQRVRLEAQEEIRKRDDELRRFRDILSKVVKERDEAHDKCQRLLVEKLSHHNLQQKELKQVVAAPVSGVTSIEDEVKGLIIRSGREHCLVPFGLIRFLHHHHTQKLS
ncbi:unnamed protein product [Rhodiola kirilowii]